ncbi:TIGR00730 family Rossman fold protein [Paludibacterium yongneupense]|uniref:LOG family protein n=1 Tax=Paludibacterium yongneupense TaxID=400061 RepID=UPI000405964B|nr:TIGR00730 family Rossman fold protein [Paludibacterium yongneupense]
MKIAVFCGSSSGNNPEFTTAAQALGRTLAARDIELVYGGGKVGLMGTIADAVLAAGGKVTGVIPRALEAREVAHTSLSALHVVGDMHERKALMAQMADGFIAMPGGAGTLEEIFEAWTWAQLGYHRKPCGFLNVARYYDKLIAFMDDMVDHGFMKSPYREMVRVEHAPEPLLDALLTYTPPLEKWATARP